LLHCCSSPHGWPMGAARSTATASWWHRGTPCGASRPPTIPVIRGRTSRRSWPRTAWPRQSFGRASRSSSRATSVRGHASTMSTSLVSLASLVSAFNPVTPQLRVAAMIVRGTQILLVEHRKRGERYWVLPGGRLEGLETLEAALRRELREELSLDARVGELVIVSEMLAPDRHVVNLMFHA